MDIRIKTNFLSHVKTTKLKRRLGPDGVLALIGLWCYAAENKSHGTLSGMSEEDIELAAGWLGESGKLVAALVEVAYLDLDGKTYRLHDWTEHNPWITGARERSLKAKLAVWTRDYGKAKARQMMNEFAPDYLVDNLKDDSGSSSRSSPSPSPFPSPFPLPSPTSKEKTIASRDTSAKPSRASRARKHPGFNPVPIYCEEYKSQNHSTPTIDGKDAGLLAKLAKLYPDPEVFRKLCRAYLKDPTQWIVDSGYRVSDFYNRRNAYAQAVRRSQVEQFDAELDEGSDEPLPGEEDPQEAPKLSPPKLPRPPQKPALPSGD